MIATLDYELILFYIALGVVGAAVLLFYIRKLNPKNKRAVFTSGLFLASAIYLVFALTTQDIFWITVESVGLLLFLLFVWMAYHYSMWFVVFGWALHIVWDVGVHPYDTAPYVPYWYAWVCVGFDAVIASAIARKLIRDEQVQMTN
jgi:hypothetical protein